MPSFRLAPEAEAALDSIWLHIARESGNPDIADRVVDDVTTRFWLLARYPYLGRSRDVDLIPGVRSIPVKDYVILYRVVEHDLVLILHVAHGSRDIPALLRP